jgi:hypothetical protein
MVSKRNNIWVSTLHASIHFILMILLVGQARSAIWPYLLLLASIHLIQDRIKNSFTNKRPDLIGKGYIIDQTIHYVIIWAAVWWFQSFIEPFSAPERPVWVIVAITYLVVTYVWFISERIFNLSNSDYLQNINNTKFPRMLSRAGILSLFLLIRTRTMPGLGVLFSNPYPKSEFRQRAILTDLGVSASAVIFLVLTLG